MDGLADKRMEELLLLAEHDPETRFQLSLNYANGDGVEQNWEKCAEWSRQASEQSDAEAPYALFVLYSAGRGPVGLAGGGKGNGGA